MPPKRRHRKSINESGHVHELTFSYFHKFTLLSKDRTCEWLADSIRQACKTFDFSLWAMQACSFT
jgi:hypothetical protein